MSNDVNDRIRLADMIGLQREMRLLRRQLNEWASRPEWSLLVRYELLPQKPAPLWRQRMTQRVGRWLRVMGWSRSRYLRQRWDAGLKHSPVEAGAKTLLIWSEGHDRQVVRDACKGFQRLLASRTDLALVLVTDVADFAFFSRLGWLVEYLPDLSGDGPSYRDRKRRYLAWCYRDALAVPLSVGFVSESDWSELLGIVSSV